MVAPYQPAWVNPMGQGMNGLAEDFTVSRMSPSGEMTQRQPNNPATKGFFNSDNPASFIPQVIRREDFPEGPEGDQAYQDALTNFLNGGSVNVANRTEGQQNVWDAQQAGAARSAGGSSTLALQSWAQLHPEEALNALMAVNPGTGETFLDDASIRDIVAGLGGIGVVNQMIEAERQNLRSQGVIPNSSPGAQGAPNMAGGTPLPPGDTFTPTPGEGGPPVTGVSSPAPGSNGMMTPVTTTLPDRPADGRARSRDQPAAYPNQGPGMVGSPTVQPYQMQQNGEVVGAEPIPGSYQYTPVGQDVYLDVTDPQTGQVHRFTGDIVEAAAAANQTGSFDEMVATYGYDTAVAILFGYIQPPVAAPAPTGAPPQNVYTPAPPPPQNYFPEPALPPQPGNPVSY